MSAPARGKFITFEGLDGCGKSTQLARLASHFRHSTSKIDVVSTREPGGTALGDRIRSLLLDSRTTGLDVHTELALMFASRAQHVYQLILPALSAGKVVLCDRFTDSSEAYQGGGRELGAEPVLALHRLLCGGLQPDLTILLDSDVAGSVARARRRNLAHARTAGRMQSSRMQSKKTHNRQKDEGRFEHENQAFFGRVQRAYHEIARREPQRVAVIDARRSINVVHKDIVNVVRERLGL